MSACNKCEAPPSFALSIYYDECSATASKCGFDETPGEESTPPKRYKRRVSVTEQHDNFTVHVGANSRSSTKESLQTITEVYTLTPSEFSPDGFSCELTTEDCGGEGTWTNTKSGDDACSDTVTWNPCTESPDSPTCNSGTAEGTEGEETDYTTFDDTDSTHYKSGFARTLSITGPGSATGSVEYGTYLDVTISEEDTTAAMITRAEDRIEFPGDELSGSPSSYRYLREDEIVYEIRRAKWKLKHNPTMTCYLKVWLKAVTSPDGEGEDTEEDLDPYIWEGTGNPCFEGEFEDLIEGDEHDLLEPEVNGTKTIEIVKYSCIEGYEPTDLTDSGFPVPEEDEEE